MNSLPKALDQSRRRAVPKRLDIDRDNLDYPLRDTSPVVDILQSYR